MTAEDESTLRRDLNAMHISIMEVQKSVIRIESFYNMLQDHEHRMRELEAFSNKAKGAMFFAASSGSLAGGLIVALITLIVG